MTELHVLNLGAGVQSTTLYLLSQQCHIQKFDAAIFADTQDEPGAEERRRGLPDPPSKRSGEICSASRLAGRCRKAWWSIQYIGISWDERTRAFDIQRRFLRPDGSEKERWKVRFILLTLNGDGVPGWTRADCERFNEIHVPHKVYGSSCIHCPYHDDDEWRRVLAMGASGERLVQIDAALRTPGVIANRNLDEKLWLHRSCHPIDKVEFKNSRQMGFVMECEGGCGL